MFFLCFFFQAEDGIRDLVRSRGLGDVYKRQDRASLSAHAEGKRILIIEDEPVFVELFSKRLMDEGYTCLLYTSDAADERSSVDLGGRRIIKKTQTIKDVVYRRKSEDT